MVRCGAGAWTVGPLRIVGVFAVGHGVEAKLIKELAIDPREKFVLAEEAPVHAVRHVLGALTLVRLYLVNLHPDVVCDLVRDPALSPRKRG